MLFPNYFSRFFRRLIIPLCFLNTCDTQITGSICSLIGNVKDVLPYAPDLLGDFKGLIVDPNPEVRANAAKALGQLYKGLGESNFEGLVQWLIELLKSGAMTDGRHNNIAIQIFCADILNHYSFSMYTRNFFLGRVSTLHFEPCLQEHMCKIEIPTASLFFSPL